MIAISHDRLRLSMKQVEASKQAVLKRGDAGYRQKLFYLFGLAVKVSPQFSGQFAANWNIVVDGNMPVFKPWPGKYALETVQRHDGKHRLQPHQAGDMEAVNSSTFRGLAQLKGVTLKSRVHFVNATELDTDGILMYGPDGVERLRPENVIPGHVRIEAYLRARVRELGGSA